MILKISCFYHKPNSEFNIVHTVPRNPTLQILTLLKLHLHMHEVCTMPTMVKKVGHCAFGLCEISDTQNTFMTDKGKVN